MNRNVFTYGSLMFAEVWSLVVEGSHASIAATLRHHARYAIRYETYPGMVDERDASVSGVLHLDVDAADLVRLDRFEGDDYERKTVEVVDGDGVARTADTYVYRCVDRLLPAAWEPDSFALRRFIETYCRDRLDP